MHKRIFISIPIPGEWQEKFLDFSKQFSVRDVRWTAKENIHITVCFLGDTKEESITDIQEKLRGLCASTEPFSLSFDRIDFAPPGMPPRMVWAIFHESAAYRQLVQEMHNELRSFLTVDPHEEIIPHATLARFKDPVLAREIDIMKLPSDLASCTVQSVDLVESCLTPAGIQHTTLETFLLGKTA